MNLDSMILKNLDWKEKRFGTFLGYIITFRLEFLNEILEIKNEFWYFKNIKSFIYPIVILN